MKRKMETLEGFDNIIKFCKELFLKKNKDYGPSWLIIRWVSLIDQIWIKAKRIRRLEEISDKKLILEGKEVEYIGIINYCIIGLIRLWYKEELPSPHEIINEGKIVVIDEKKIFNFYGDIVNEVRELLIKKNHDYGEAWREMEISSITDQILVKLLRIKKILKNGMKTQISEGLDAQFCDIINYAVFALIKLELHSSIVNENLDKQCSKKKYGVAVLIIDKKKRKNLIVKRGNVKYFPNMWSIITGNILENEKPINAAKREVKEELNISLTEKDLKNLGIFVDETAIESEKVHAILYCYIAAINLNRVNLQLKNHENTSIKIINFKDILKIDFPPVIKKIIYAAKKEE